MEQEERDGYVKKYEEDSAESRRIMAAFHNRVVTELVGPQAKEWLKALDLLAKIECPTQKLFDVLAKLLPKSSSFPIWRVVKLGVGPKTGNAFAKAIKKAGMNVSDWAKDILGKPTFTVAPEEIELKLVRVTVAELGFENGATRAEIYEKAQEFGLGLCPAEVGPQLRLQYADQAVDEYLLVGMEPIAGSGGDLDVFDVGHGGGGRWLNSNDGRAGDIWSGGRQWLFVSRK